MSAGSVLQSLGLFSQRFHQTCVFKRGGAQLLQHRFHFNHRLPRAITHVFERLTRAPAVAGPAFLRRRGANIDTEDLLFDRIVEVTRQSISLLLSRRFAQLSDPSLTKFFGIWRQSKRPKIDAAEFDKKHIPET